MKKVNVAVIFGGTNTEHEVSIVSAASVIKYLPKDKYNILPVYIDKNNNWQTPKNFLTNPEETRQLTSGQKDIIQKDPQEITKDHAIEVFFPVLHGPFGEDGTIQGMLEMMHVPYVGCNVLASAVCMDKVIQKQICQTARIPMAKYLHFSLKGWQKDEAQILNKITANLGFPVFVKPANQGSSVGISKAKNEEELIAAIHYASKYDLKIVVEAAIPNAREIECSVLGNEDPQASVLGEIVPSSEFYDYDSKYIDGQSQALIPAPLAEALSQKIRQTAIKAFKQLNCSGLARVDFLLDNRTKNFYLSEVNTMPGFTHISMYPKLWEATGIPYEKLLDTLINLSLERHQEKSKITLSYQPKTNWHQS